LDLTGPGGITAILGPTNTGKTHRAVERMLRFGSGMIGLPLRLLAREIYERVVARVGTERVALVTGEEKRIPHGARYWVCTVESMPVDRPVAFLAVDEVQLAAHPERGHIFTSRILDARGVAETWFLGSETIAPLLEQLVPTAQFETFPRFSSLRYAGRRKLTALPPRSAVVAFSAAGVYELAERLKARHGGTAVVLGALSPRTRNAQVDMYQQGEVQYMVATDAIGMGLNLDLHHVALSGLHKYDGREVRGLEAAELAQVAGRAGRFRRDGTFGATGQLEGIPLALVEAVEQHRFPSLRFLWYRNADLDFGSVDALRESLREEPRSRLLRRVPQAEDERTLDALARRDAVREVARGERAVRLLWDVCRVPDYRKLLFQDHYALLEEIYLQLAGRDEVLQEDWVAGRLKRLDRVQGEIEALMTRIAFVRTWTYVAYRGDWLKDPEHWQGRARGIEDRLSDALHDRLARRFVDRRTMLLLRTDGDALDAIELDEDGELRAGEHRLGHLEGLRFVPAGDLVGLHGETAWKAVRRGLQGVMAQRVDALERAEFGDFEVDERGMLCWEGARLGQLVAGPGVLEPRVRALQQELISGEQRTRLRRRLERWTRELVDQLLEPLRRPEARQLGQRGRAVVYALEQGLGVAPAAGLPLRELSRADRRLLARLDVRLGTEHAFVSSLLGPRWLRLRAALWCVSQGALPVPPLAWAGEPALPRPGHVPPPLARVLGYALAGDWLLRVDLLEELAFRLRRLARRGPFAAPDELREPLGCSPEQLDTLVESLGYPRLAGEGDRPRFGRRVGASERRSGRGRRGRR
jgi:ATP-dependent RNA helicase SUPV3L1/SUV3